MESPINERPSYLDIDGPTKVYVTVSVMFMGDIKEADSSFSLDAYVDVAWRDDRFGNNSGQAFGCTPPTVGIMLLTESYAPTYCQAYCTDTTPWCNGYAAPAPWSPFLEVTNIAPQFNVDPLSYPTAYVVSSGPPGRLRLNDTEGTWAVATARFTGPILKVYPLQDFPYDKQRLDVLFESNQWTSSDVELIAAYDPMEVKRGILSSKSMLGWDVQDVSVTTTKNFYSQLDVTYNQIAMSVTVSRQAAPYAQRYIMPGFFIIIMMLLASIHAEGSVRVANGVAGFASILYLQFILTSTVPPLNYVTRLDKFFLVALVICFVSCIVGGAHVYRETLEKAAAKEAEGAAKKSSGQNGNGPAAVVYREPAAVVYREPAAVVVREPTQGDGKDSNRTPLQVCLARRNPFSGESWTDLACYGLIFVVFSIASACVLLA
jgi:hypothetical protein